MCLLLLLFAGFSEIIYQLPPHIIVIFYLNRNMTDELDEMFNYHEFYKKVV